MAKESEEVADAADRLQAKADSGSNPAAPLHLGLAIMSFTDVNWRAATSTGAVQIMNYVTVARYAGAYFEQARLAQLQVSTVEALMALQSYVGRGDRVELLTRKQAQSAAVAARLLGLICAALSETAQKK